MTHEEIDAMWQQAMRESIKDGEVFTRYHFAKLVAQHEREACVKLLETTDLGGLKDNPSMQNWIAEMLLAYVKAIRARGQA